MSLKPGIGANGFAPLVNFLHTKEGARVIAETGDVPPYVRWQGQKWPIGRYLQGRLRAAVGFESGKTPERVLATVAGKRAALLDAFGLDYFDNERKAAEAKAFAKQRQLREKESL